MKGRCTHRTSLFRFSNRTVEYDDKVQNPDVSVDYAFGSFGYQPPLSLYAPTHYGNYTVILRASTQNGTGKGVSTIFTIRSPEGRK